MNKYKMMAMCSLVIVIMLVLNLLLPLRSNANDKESLDINLHYEKSTVTVDITVNSDIYTGVVCKYFAVDDVLAYDDLAYQTKENGTILNVNKIEKDKYKTTIENVTTRYVVVYVSIGNCTLCDYIDCKPSSNNSEDNTQNSSTKNEEAENENQKPENQDKTEDTAVNEEKKQEINTDDFDTIEEIIPDKGTEKNTQTETTKQEKNKTQQTETTKQEENKTQQTGTTKQEENKTQQTGTTKQEENKTQQKGTTKQEENKTQQEQKDTKKTSNNSTVTTSSQPINLNKYDKDTIDTAGFQEIESTDKNVSTSTVGTKMPKTGENDTIKIAGIIIFSIVGLISFYKYKKSCKNSILD